MASRRRWTPHAPNHAWCTPCVGRLGSSETCMCVSVVHTGSAPRTGSVAVARDTESEALARCVSTARGARGAAARSDRAIVGHAVRCASAMWTRIESEAGWIVCRSRAWTLSVVRCGSVRSVWSCCKRRASSTSTHSRARASGTWRRRARRGGTAGASSKPSLAAACVGCGAR